MGRRFGSGLGGARELRDLAAPAVGLRRAALVSAVALALAGCGGDEQSYPDTEIVAALHLEREGDGYLLGGDPFCAVSTRFFNDAGEVEAANASEGAGVVVASREGNVGIEGIPKLFGPDCEQQARRELDRLDPRTRDR